MGEPEPGSFVHVEFASTDPRRTRKFLEDVFGWEFQSMPGMEYHVYATARGPGGAVMGTAERPAGVLNYLLSRDLETDVGRIERAGGRIRVPKTEIPGVGWWVVFEEPTGLVLALFQSLSPDRGPEARYRRGSARRGGPSTGRKPGRGRRGL